MVSGVNVSVLLLATLAGVVMGRPNATAPHFHTIQLGRTIINDIGIWWNKVQYRTPQTIQGIRSDIFAGMMGHLEQLQQDRTPTLFPDLIEFVSSAKEKDSIIESKLRELEEITEGTDAIVARIVKHQIDYIHDDEMQRNITSLRSDSINGYIDRLRLLTTGSIENFFGHNNIYSSIRNYLNANPSALCALAKSEQQLINELFEKCLNYLTMNYLIKQVSLLLLNLNGNGNYLTYGVVFENKMIDVLNLTETYFAGDFSAGLSADVWRCDPETHVPGDTYLTLKRFQQGYITNEVHLNADHSCSKKCEDYTMVPDHVYNRSPFIKDYVKKEPCQGTIRDCKFLANKMDVCQVDPDSSKSSRRYSFIKYDHQHVGSVSDEECSGGGLSTVETWRDWFYRCTFCFCLCDEEGPKTERYFNLREYVTDTDNNYIVTGLRFVMQNRVVHLQIAENQVLPNGFTNASSDNWQPLSNYSITDAQIIEDLDYYKLTNSSNSIDLEDITAIAGYVITGARFIVFRNHLKLEARITQFNYTTGQLRSETSHWIKSDSYYDEKMEISLATFDLSLNSLEKTEPLRETNRFMSFSPSNMGNDLAQNTIPYLDAQGVVTRPTMPLKGIGLYYKTKEYYAGFIAPKLITYDLIRGDD